MEDIDTQETPQVNHAKSSIWSEIARLIPLLVLFTLIVVFGIDMLAGQPSKATTSQVCTQPVVRREWRTLSNDEKDAYVSAVLCLSGQPSLLHPIGTSHDDFAWLHANIGASSHSSAAFLPWHRYFLHIYETNLRETCAYKGHLPLWDWTLDWQSIFSSPVWDPDHGFGGNGNQSEEASLNYGRCVTDGPFTSLQLSFADPDARNHCLSRGFQDSNFHNFSSHNLRPQVIEQILQTSKYDLFVKAVEEGPHDIIPNMVRGDFWLLTAPNDPVFYLHHVALDRLWWLWQQQGPSVRFQEYFGQASDGSAQTASLTDVLPMLGYGRDVMVADVMNARSGLLCYGY